jgi:hypothetical protein
MVGLLHGWRRWVALLGTTAALVALPASAALASHVDNGRDDAFSSCVRGIGQFGGYLHIDAHDGLTWTSPRDATFDFANQAVAVHDCGPTDPRIRGGRVRFSSSLEFFGDRITSCQGGIPSGVSCVINLQQNHLAMTMTRPSWVNDAGTANFNIGNVRATTGNLGHLSTARFMATDSLSAGADTASITARIDHHI